MGRDQVHVREGSAVPAASGPACTWPSTHKRGNLLGTCGAPRTGRDGKRVHRSRNFAVVAHTLAAQLVFAQAFSYASREVKTCNLKCSARGGQLGSTLGTQP